MLFCTQVSGDINEESILPDMTGLLSTTQMNRYRVLFPSLLGVVSSSPGGVSTSNEVESTFVAISELSETEWSPAVLYTIKQVTDGDVVL